MKVFKRAGLASGAGVVEFDFASDNEDASVQHWAPYVLGVLGRLDPVFSIVMQEMHKVLMKCAPMALKRRMQKRRCSSSDRGSVF
jgi:hypothetical protein